MVRATGRSCKLSGFKLPLSVANEHLDIYFSGLYVRRRWFIGIKSGLGPVDLSSVQARSFRFNRIITVSKFLNVFICSG